MLSARVLFKSLSSCSVQLYVIFNIIVDTEVSLSTVTRFISKNNLKFRNSSTERKAFELENPNDCWQADTSVGPYLIIDGKKKKTVLIMVRFIRAINLA